MTLGIFKKHGIDDDNFDELIRVFYEDPIFSKEMNKLDEIA